MSKRKIVKAFALCSCGLAFSGTASLAVAHTSIADQVTEGKSAYTSVVIGHGCERSNGAKVPVTAQSVAFPTANTLVSGGTVVAYSEAALSNEDNDGTIENSDFTAGDPDVAVTLPGMVDLVQSKDIFLKQDEKYAPNTTNTIGFHAANGKLQTNLRGLVPFRVSTSKVKFNPNSCAKSLIIQVAVADICGRTFPPQHDTANVWMPNFTGQTVTNSDGTFAPIAGQTSTKFTDTDLHGIGAPAKLTINRDTTATPYPASCDEDSEAGSRFSVTIMPTAADVDANLPFQFWR